VIENRGRSFEGALEVVVTSGSEFRGDVRDTTYTMDVELPTRSRKKYALTIYIDSFIHPLIIRLTQAHGTIVTESLNLRSHYTEDKLILFLGIENTPDLSSMPAKGIRPIVSRARFLPERWIGYEGVKSIVLDTMDIEYLSDRQFIALTEWIRKGGQLITSGRLNYGSFLNQRTMRLLPLNVLGLERLFEIASLEKFCGVSLTSAEGFLVLKVDFEGALTLLQEGDMPIIFQKKLDLGDIIFLAFNFNSSPFAEWSGRQAFWARILSEKVSHDEAGSDLKEQDILKAMISSIPARFPTFGFVLLFTVAYAILVQVIFSRLKKYREQRGKHFRILLLVIALFSLSSYGLFFNRNQQKDPTYNSFIHMRMFGQSMVGRAAYIGGLYGLKAGKHQMDLGQEFYPIIPIEQKKPRDTKLHALSFYEKDGEQSLSIPLEGWSHRFFKMTTRMTFRVRGRATVDDQDLLIMVENMTAHRILDGHIYYKGRFFAIGDIAPGKRRVERISKGEINKRALFNAENVSLVAEGMVGDKPFSLLENIKKNLLTDLLLQVHSRYRGEQEKMVLFGWINAHVIPNPFIGPHIDSDGVALLEWETPIERVQGDEE